MAKKREPRKIGQKREDLQKGDLVTSFKKLTK